MKKIFTTISLAVMMLIPSMSVFAQSKNLTEADKNVIKKEVLPAVFQQIKQQTGLDIMGLAKPQLSGVDFLNSPYFKLASSLRSDKVNLDFVADSIKMDLSAISAIPAGVIGLIGNELIVTFNGYSETPAQFPIAINDRYINLNMPTSIVIGTNNVDNLAQIDIATDLTKYTVDMTMTCKLLSMDAAPLVCLSMTSDETTYNTDIKVALGTALKSIIKLIDSDAVPEYDFMLRMNVAQLMSGIIPVTIFAAPAATNFATTVPLYAATVGMNISTLTPYYVDLTEYEEGKADKWMKIWMGYDKATVSGVKNTVITANLFAYTSAEKTDSVYAGADILTMVDYTGAAVSTKAAVQEYLSKIVTDLSADETIAPYQLMIQEVSAKKDTSMVLTATATPSMTASGIAALVNIKSFDADTVENDYDVTANLEKGKVVVAAMPAGAASALVTGYFSSNIYDILTPNETVNATAGAVKVTNAVNGLYVSNATKGSYRVIDMMGAVKSNGVVTSDYTFVTTSNLAHGVYVIVVNAEKGNVSFKFAK